MVSERTPQEEVSKISESGFPIETSRQAELRRDRVELEAFKDKYGGLNDTAANVVSAIRHELLITHRAGEDTSEQEDMLNFLSTELGIDISTRLETGSITLAELKEKVEGAKETYKSDDPKMKTVENTLNVIDQTRKDISRGRSLEGQLIHAMKVAQAKEQILPDAEYMFNDPLSKIIEVLLDLANEGKLTSEILEEALRAQREVGYGHAMNDVEASEY